AVDHLQGHVISGSRGRYIDPFVAYDLVEVVGRVPEITCPCRWSTASDGAPARSRPLLKPFRKAWCGAPRHTRSGTPATRRPPLGGSAGDFTQLRDDLGQSVQERIRKTTELGSDPGHGERQAAEQQLIKQIEKVLDDNQQ
ncbi:MAG: hypothetical protein AAF211_03925, partial [Myxococcota bacterium]